MSIVAAIRHEFSGLLDFLLPPACLLCGQITEANHFCPSCSDGFHPLPSPRCPRCALPFLTEGGTDHLCEGCLRKDPHFLQVHALGLYEGSLREAVHRFKYQGAFHFDLPLGRFLADSLRKTLCDLVVPVPLHPRRLRERTYNQSLLLARAVGRELVIPVRGGLLERVRSTPPQQGLSADERQRNLRGAFRLGQKLSGEHVLLVDDVLTTGATARECSRVLKSSGAGAVTVAVLARAPRYL